jgi:uracil-DNA glycosylase
MPFGGLDKGDLSYLVKQGVFLYNTALTVQKGNPGSHIELWQEFTSKIIETINKIDFVVWILLGRFAASFESKINSKHICLKADHPSYHNYSKDAKFIGSGIFRQCNYHLNKHNSVEIVW